MEAGQKFFTATVIGSSDGGIAWISEHTVTGSAPGLVTYTSTSGKPFAAAVDDVFATRDAASRWAAGELARLRDKAVAAYDKRIEELLGTEAVS